MTDPRRLASGFSVNVEDWVEEKKVECSWMEFVEDKVVSSIELREIVELLVCFIL